MIYCKDCVFFDRLLRSDLTGLCHRYPPQVSYRGYSNENKESNFPSVSEYTWCGEAKKRDLKNDQRGV